MWLVINDSGISLGEQELERSGKDNERGNLQESDHCQNYQSDSLEDEFNEEFWARVMKMNSTLKDEHFVFLAFCLILPLDMFKLDLHVLVKVHRKQTEGFSWNRAMDEVQVEEMIQKYKDGGERDSEDPALVMLKQWPASEKYENNPGKLRGLEQKINRFLEILFEGELSSGNRYEEFQDKDDETRKTLMHYAAELGFLHVTQTLVRECPLLLAVKTEEQQTTVTRKRALLPVELAIVTENDDVAAYLIRVMSHDRVQRLFSWRPGKMTNPKPSLFSFKAIIENPKMKKTVVAVLDQMVNPHWAYLPKRGENYGTEEEREAIEGIWSTISDDPLNYHFHYHVLDGDKGGRPPKILASDGHQQIENKYFNWRDKSCLHAIATSNNKEALQHPVVKMLIKSKWKSYGHLFLRLQAALYCIFLLFLSYSLLRASIKSDPSHYSGALDSLRGFCEVVTLLMVVFYICEEINHIRIEGHSYFTEWMGMTLFDWLGLLLILCIIPLRYMAHEAQWVVSSLAFLFNLLRIFKFSCVSRTTGLYTQTLAKIILQDVTRSMAVFIVIFFSFCGALSLSLCYSGSSENQELGYFGDILLRGFRALSEPYPMVEDYTALNWLSILLTMAYIGTLSVILLNFLVAQMSTAYAQAKKVARLEYDVDRILQLTRMERFPFLNLRVKYYKEGDWISEMRIAKDLLDFIECRNPLESVEEKLKEIRNVLKEMAKQMRPARE